MNNTAKCAENHRLKRPQKEVITPSYHHLPLSLTPFEEAESQKGGIVLNLDLS